MRKLSTGIVVAAALAATTMAVAASGPAARADSAPSAARAVAILAGSTPPFAVAANALGAVPAGSRLTIQFWLKPQTAAATGYASAVSTPGNPLFERYLAPAVYTARFGPSSAEAASVEAWLRSAGFSGVSADSGRDYVAGTASVSAIDSALRTQLRYYRPTAGVNAGGYQLRANDGPVSLPASVAAGVLGVTGLENAAPAADLRHPEDLGRARLLGGQADLVPLLVLVRPALRAPAAAAVRDHQLPHRHLRLLGRPAPPRPTATTGTTSARG